MVIGKVFLVGAGPGDPDLITLKGINALRQANVVIHDSGVHKCILNHAPDIATRIDVCKLPRHSAAAQQAHINRMLIEFAKLSKTVVRLKDGDPFIFGNGDDEAAALSAAAIPFEVIPGISAAIGVPTAAVIPLTHATLAEAFAVFSASLDGDDDSVDHVDWEVATRIPTAIFLNGIERLPVIVAELLAHGRSADTPIAVIEQGTLSQQRVVTGSLRDILTRSAHAESPAMIVVGSVVALRQKLVREIETPVAKATADAEVYQALIDVLNAPPCH